ncbi:MAG: recombinase family protein [Roseburia sp.]|nr:recombinase family protein [Roseburia sp.]
MEKRILGMPEYTNAGVIKAIGRYGEKYSVAKIEYQTFADGQYQYVFTPYWDIIDGIQAGVFYGIPGIDMKMRRKVYYRVNVQPVFITERSPSEDREDVQELMESVGLGHYDRFEWLIRTGLFYGNDNLVVERYRAGRRCYRYGEEPILPEMLRYGDRVMIKSHDTVSKNPTVYTERVLGLLGAGAEIVFEKEGIVIDERNRSSVMAILGHQYYRSRLLQIKKREKGVSAAKKRGAYRGRKPIVIDELTLRRVSEQFRTKKITEVQAMKRLGIRSRSTFYRKLKSVRSIKF